MSWRCAGHDDSLRSSASGFWTLQRWVNKDKCLRFAPRAHIAEIALSILEIQPTQSSNSSTAVGRAADDMPFLCLR